MNDSVRFDHLLIIKRHLASMITEVTKPFDGQKVNTQTAVRIADEMTDFLSGLKAVVNTIGTKLYPTIVSDQDAIDFENHWQGEGFEEYEIVNRKLSK